LLLPLAQPYPLPAVSHLFILAAFRDCTYKSAKHAVSEGL
jgi:hypothetical protein